MRRPKLGPWFTERVDEWDTIVVWRLDRLVRKVADLAELITWCEANGKNIVSATEPFDLATPLGKALIYLVAVFAEIEAGFTRERVTGAQKTLRETGRWGGGGQFFGTMPVANPDGKGWVLDEDPEASPILMELVNRVTSGEAMNSVMLDFNARKILSPSDYRRVARGRPAKGVRWSVANIADLLRSPSLLGYTAHDGKLFRGPDGLPVKKGPAFLTRTQFDRLQAAMSRRTFKAPRSEDVSPLLDVAFCRLCKGPIYCHATTRGEKVYRYYKCPEKNVRKACEARNVRADVLELAVEDSLLARIGDWQVFDKIEIAGHDHTNELLDIDQALRDLREDRAAGLFKGEQGSKEFRETYTKLEARRETLAADPKPSRRAEFVDTGRTWNEVWAEYDGSERRRLLMDAGIKAFVSNGDGLVLDLIVPADLEARVRAASV